MKESPEEKRRRLMELAKASVTSAYSTGEHSVILAINTYNEVERTRNLVHEKLEDWYGIFFPELRLNNQITYAKFILEFGSNKKRSNEELAPLLGDAAEDVASRAERSIGNEPNAQEYEMLKATASTELELARLEESLDAYLNERVKAMMPNISYLIDYKVAAELLAKAGSLSKLALMPASTIQLLGAEKALFKHIKFHSKPPKYGVLFKLPQISAANKPDRGRIARIYATKICIAAKADAFTKNFIAKQLKEQLDATVQRYKEQNRQERPQQSRGFERRQGGGYRGNFRPRNQGNRQNRGNWQDRRDR